MSASLTLTPGPCGHCERQPDTLCARGLVSVTNTNWRAISHQRLSQVSCNAGLGVTLCVCWWPQPVPHGYAASARHKATRVLRWRAPCSRSCAGTARLLRVSKGIFRSCAWLDPRPRSSVAGLSTRVLPASGPVGRKLFHWDTLYD